MASLRLRQSPPPLPRERRELAEMMNAMLADRLAVAYSDVLMNIAADVDALLQLAHTEHGRRAAEQQATG